MDKMGEMTIGELGDVLNQSDKDYLSYKQIEVDKWSNIVDEINKKVDKDMSSDNYKYKGNLTDFFAYLLLCCEHEGIKYEDLNLSGIISTQSGSHYYYETENDIYLNNNQYHKKNFSTLIKLLKEKKSKSIDDKVTVSDPHGNNTSDERSQTVEKEELSGKKISELISNSIENNYQVIFTGAPGTGKTFSVREYVKGKCNNDESRYKFVQFHPSYDYSDFVEGLRPVMLSQNGAPTFVRVDGIFKGFCRQIVEANLKKAIGDLTDEKKSTELENLHDSIKKAKDNNSLGEKEKKFAWGNENGEPNDDSMYYFIIDEINRADLSKVFGELMFGLEESYRGIENRFDTQYKNLKTYEINKGGIAQPMNFDCFENGFFIPHNLKIIGTMNDIDRSVETFDFALRRRFQWIDIKANVIMRSSLQSMLSGIAENDIDSLAEKVIAMNEELTKTENKFGLSEAYHIGPAYFKDYCKNENGEGNLEDIFDYKIEPIIREYTRGRSKDSVEKLVDNCREKLSLEKKQHQTS